MTAAPSGRVKRDTHVASGRSNDPNDSNDANDPNE